MACVVSALTYGKVRLLFILTCTWGGCPGDSEYSTQTLTHGPQQEADGENTQMDQPTHRLWGQESWGRQVGVGGDPKVVLTIWARGRPSYTVSVYHTQKERKPERERESGGGPWFGRAMDEWMDGWREKEEWTTVGGVWERKTEDERDCLISVCTYQHMDHWTFFVR